jgi:hypothetical protein
MFESVLLGKSFNIHISNKCVTFMFNCSIAMTRYFQMSGITFPVTQHHMSEDWTAQLHHNNEAFKLH